MRGALGIGVPLAMGSAVALALVLVMMRLVMPPDPDLSRARQPVIMDFTKVDVLKPAERRTRQLPPPPTDAPDRPVEEVKAEDSIPQDAVIVRPDLLARPSGQRLSGVRAGYGSVDLAGLGGNFTAVGPNQDRYAQPLVRVAPIYPMAARIRKITGYVLVEFDVTAEGTVANPTVVGSEPSGIFDSAAIEAIRKWRYKPKVVNGQPQPVPNMLIKLTFDKMPDGQGTRRGR